MMRCTVTMVVGLGAVLGTSLSARANFATFGIMDNDGSQLTFTALVSENYPTLDQEPFIPGFDLPRGFGSSYYGKGETHAGTPLLGWTGDPTDVGVRITGLMFEGSPVGGGFVMDSGEYNAFEDIFVFGLPPDGTVGIGQDLLLVDSHTIHESQTGEPTDPDYSNHAHVYFQADQVGTWDVTFVLTDMAATPIYTDSDPFTIHFSAVPEPTMSVLMMLGAAVAGYRRRH